MARVRVKEGRRRAAGRCTFCPEAAYAVRDVHRIVPGAAGGTYAWANTVPVCSNCHRRIHAGLITIHGRRLTSSGRHVLHCTIDHVEQFVREPHLFDE